MATKNTGGMTSLNNMMKNKKKKRNTLHSNTSVIRYILNYK